MRRNRFIKATSVLLCMALLVITRPGAQVSAHNASAQDTATTTATPARDEMVVARITIRDREELERLVRSGLDLLEMRDGDDLFILTTAAQVQALASEGWLIRTDAEQSALLVKQKGALSGEMRAETFADGYRTVVEMRAALQQAAATHPNLAEVFVYGSSFERLRTNGVGGHDLFGIRLTNRQRPGPKPVFFLMAAIHARELTTSELALRFMDYLLTGYGVDADATWLLDEHEVVIVPVVNPDGRVIAEQGYYQRKNTNNTYGGNCAQPPTGTNQYGVDLNRNSSFGWGIVNIPTEPRCGQTYPGPSPASEPETQALENLVRSLFPDQRGPAMTDPAPQTATGVMITLHSFSNLVLWPWGVNFDPAPNALELSSIGRRFASYNGFTPQQSIQLYPTSGTTDDWAYGELGVAAFTFEVGPESGACGGFFPAYSCLDGGTGGSFWPRNLPAFLHAARIARAPYQLGQGPVAASVTVTSAGANQLEIHAQLSDLLPTDEIAAAEYYIDTPPWRGGTPHPMTASDGSFNSASELASVSTVALSGRHTVYVRGRDASGNWGPVSAAFTPQAPQTNQWSPAVLNSNQVSVQTWRQSDSNTYAKVQLNFPSEGYRVLDQNWGAISRSGNQISVDALVEQFTGGASATVLTTTANIYNLGQLAPGDYAFTFKSSGATAATVNFTVSNTAPPANPLDNPDQREFVRWQYKDFLGREPDQAGWDFWTANITKCADAVNRQPGQSEADCVDKQRTTTSAAFFLSPEFQYTGYYVYRIYKGALGRAPYLSEFTQDRAIVGNGIVVNDQLAAAVINQNKRILAEQFVQRPAFAGLYGGLSNQDYVIRLIQTAGLTPNIAERDLLIAGLNNGTETRATVLYKIVDGVNVISEGNQQFTTQHGQAFYNQQFNSAFVQMEYFGYMKRDPDNAGFQFWLGKLNTFGNYIDAEMVRSFIVSPEYRSRFGAP